MTLQQTSDFIRAMAAFADCLIRYGVLSVFDVAVLS
jgi:hypothetical protein